MEHDSTLPWIGPTIGLALGWLAHFFPLVSVPPLLLQTVVTLVCAPIVTLLSLIVKRWALRWIDRRWPPPAGKLGDGE